jgi:hypothetical protein
MGSAARQRGIATVLVVLLTGLALTAAVLGAFGYINGLQSRSVTLHAATQAQLKAWSAVEAARQYLTQLGPTATAALTAPSTMTIAGLTGVTGTVTSITASDTTFCNGNTRAQLAFSATGGPATSTVETVICVSGGNTGGSSLPTTGNNIKGNLNLSGSNTMTGNGSLNIDGSLTGSGITVSGYSAVSATGNISLTNGSYNIGALTSGGNITDVAGTYTSIAAYGYINLDNGATATSVSANGNVTDAAAGSGPYGTIQSGGTVSLGQGTTVGTVKAQGNVIANGTSKITSQVLAQGNYTETLCCSTVASGTIGGTLTKVSGHSAQQTVNISVVPGTTVQTVAVPAGAHSTFYVNANDFQASANYVFSYNASNQMQVTVNNVQGLTNGTTYYLTGSGANNDYLCTSATYSSSTCKVKICNGYSAYNSCFSYNSGSWSINGLATAGSTTLVPGTVWFTGNLTVGSGNYYNTFIASGNITTASATTVTSPQYAGYSNICTNSSFSATYYPTNMCSGGAYVSTELGFVAFLAGSYNTATPAVFTGGLVSVGAQNTIKGNIVAGDSLQTSGNTTIYGIVEAAYQGAGGTGGNSFGASTTFNQQNLQTWGGGAGCYGCTVNPNVAQVLWARYR